MTDFTTTAQNIQLASRALNKLTTSLSSATAIHSPAVTTSTLTVTGTAGAAVMNVTTLNVASSGSINMASSAPIKFNGGAFTVLYSTNKLIVTISGTPAFSIDNGGNVVALGSITASGSP